MSINRILRSGGGYVFTMEAQLPPPADAGRYATTAFSDMSKKKQTWKAIEKSKVFWQLRGESELHGALLPGRPRANELTVARLTHTNTYGPLTDIEFFVRIGKPDVRTPANDLDSTKDWVPAVLVEQIVWLGDRRVPLEDAGDISGSETPWWGTYDASLSFPTGTHTIEIKILSKDPQLLPSIVLSGGWQINVQ